MPTISVIVPVYKVEKYINDCVDSLIHQSFDDIEIILVDDGSPDSCPQICDDYKLKDERIKVIHKNNEGLSAARNTGIGIATGKYICFVDSDDIVSEKYCETLLSLLDGTSYDFSVCGVKRFSNNSEINLSAQSANTNYKVYSNIDFIEMQIDKKSEFGVWNKLFRKSIFEHISFSVGRLNEDVIFSSDIAANLNSGVICTDDTLYFYRQNISGIVSSQSKYGSVHMLYAGEYLLNRSYKYYPNLTTKCLIYALNYPWSFIDIIIVKNTKKDNKEYIDLMHSFIKKHLSEYIELDSVSKIIKSRITLFAKSTFLYSLNVYFRLIRVYIFKILRKDPYKTGHGV